MIRIVFIFSLFIYFHINSQVVTPPISPIAKISQQVGLTNIEIEYSRPSVKSRKIFGGVVPYDKIWRTGANKNTIISFDKDVSFSGNIVNKGKYSIYTIPSERGWRLIFYEEIENSGMPENWDENKIVLDVFGQSYDLPFSIETFEITISNITQNTALLTLNWENQITVFPFDVFTKKEVLASIKEIISTGNATTWDYHNAALYYYQNNLDKNKSKMWFDKSLSMRGGNFPFWVYAYKAQIYNRYGDKKEALKAAEKSLEMAKKTGNHHSIGMSSRALKEVQESP